MTDELCERCNQDKPETVAGIIQGIYYRHICRRCLGTEDISSNAAGFDRRRQYEDHAQDTLQPYDAKGPNPEFARLYPDAAKKIYKPEVLEQLKRNM